MAGPWLYPISAAKGRTFDLAGGESIAVSADSYRDLVKNGRIVEDRYWYIKQHWRHVKVGDEVFIYTGDQNLGIIGYATVAEVDPDGQPRCIRLKFDLGRCRALLDNPIPAKVVRKWFKPLRSSLIDMQHVEEQLRALLPWPRRDPDADSVLPEEIVEPIGLLEGAVRSITVNAYERNPEARRRCIEALGTVCSICGCSFGAVYGPEANGYIHVHHVRPLSEINSEYEVDPVNDLRPVCPNCHAVLHLGGQCRSIEEVRRMVDDNLA